MSTLFEVKEREITDTPLLLFECTLRDGRIERWGTHKVNCEGHGYEARVLRHNIFEMQTASDQSADAIPRIAVTLGNADSRLSEIERSVGFKGAKLHVRFGFFDVIRGEPSTESATLFQGSVNPPDEITEATFRISAVNRLNLQRVLLPQVRMQRRCPWEFPSTSEQRNEAKDGGERGVYSRFYRCGYSADIEGGVGNLLAGEAFAKCNYTRPDCEARGMFDSDSAGRATRRFGGFEFVPSTIQVRSYGERGSHASAVLTSEGRYNDFVPLLYGTGWYIAPVISARNDGNLTHMEVLLGMGEIHRVVKVLVNNVELPAGRSGANMSGTGWFNVGSLGTRTGTFNLDFTNKAGRAAGDPYGSLAYLSVVVPNRLNDGSSAPVVKVLLEGLLLPKYADDSIYLGHEFSNNPAWIILDLLFRCGWSAEELALSTFSQAAAFCSEQISAKDLYNNPVTLPRFQCNLVVQARRSAGDLLRGVRNGSRLLLTYGRSGKLELAVENSIAVQQPVKPTCSNSTETLNGGWPAYDFDHSSILRRGTGEPAFRVWCRPISDTPNRFSVEFQDAFNEYQQDSMSLVDAEDVHATGQEVSVALSVLGIPNFDQAGRMLKFHLDRSVQGNTFVEFETSVKSIGLRPGDIIAVTYLKEGFQRQPFRIVRIASGLNCRTSLITAQLHRDEWFTDTNGDDTASSGGRRQPRANIGVPRPLAGMKRREDGGLDLDIEESILGEAGGAASVQLTVGFLTPPKATLCAASIPLVSLAATVGTAGGNLAGNRTLYYAITAVDDDGSESGLSFLVPAGLPGSTNANQVTLTGLSFSPNTAAFNVYRGTNPAQLSRIASAQSLATEFVDRGLPEEPAAPADGNFDHANLYWRLEIVPEVAVNIQDGRNIGNSILQLKPNELHGMAVRITKGAGAGQERIVLSNTADTITVDTNWDATPDGTSSFTVAEAGWHFGAASTTAPVQFAIPNRPGAVVQVCGRSANVADIEAPYELSPVTRWVIGGGGLLDSGPPPVPNFGVGLSSSVPGAVEISGVSFSDLTNTRTIDVGTVRLYYWNELDGTSAPRVAVPLLETDEYVSLDTPTAAVEGSFIQIDAELMCIQAVLDNSLRYLVSRGCHGSAAEPHLAEVSVYHLREKVAIVPFSRDFFGSPASGTWSYTIDLPDCRITSAELVVSNSYGQSEVAEVAVTRNLDKGLRTLSGGQACLQIHGFLAVENRAVPELFIDASHAVRDVFAIVGNAPEGTPIEIRINQDGVEYCKLVIQPGETTSNAVNGSTLRPLEANRRLSLDILSVGTTVPGSDLSVIIRM